MWPTSWRMVHIFHSSCSAYSRWWNFRAVSGCPTSSNRAKLTCRKCYLVRPNPQVLWHHVTVAVFASIHFFVNTLVEIDQKTDKMLEILEGKGLSFLFPLMKLEKELLKQIKVDPSPQSIYKWIKENVSARLHTDKGFVNILITRYSSQNVLSFCCGLYAAYFTHIFSPLCSQFSAVHFVWDQPWQRWRAAGSTPKRAAGRRETTFAVFEAGDAKVPAWTHQPTSGSAVCLAGPLQCPFFSQRSVHALDQSSRLG